jgi:hypothetical protein
MSYKTHQAFNGRAARNGKGYNYYDREAREAHVKSILHQYEAPNNWTTEQRLRFIRELDNAGTGVVGDATSRVLRRGLPEGEALKQGTLNRYKLNLGRHARPDEVRDILDESIRMIKFEKVERYLDEFFKNNITFHAEEDPGLRIREMDRIDIENALEKFARTFIEPSKKREFKQAARDFLVRSHTFCNRTDPGVRYETPPMLRLDLNDCIRADIDTETVWGFALGENRQRFLYSPPAARP